LAGQRFIGEDDLPQLAEASLAGRPDCSDWHIQGGCYLSVGRWRGCHQYPQQTLAPFADRR